MTDYPYHDGRLAHGTGVNLLANPYCPITQRACWDRWKDGWAAAEFDARNPKPAQKVRRFRPIIWS